MHVPSNLVEQMTLERMPGQGPEFTVQQIAQRKAGFIGGRSSQFDGHLGEQCARDLIGDLRAGR